MLLSKYFLPILKENPADAQIISHQLMLRSGMIRQHVSGIYSWLPLGLKVLRNIENIIRRHLDSSGCLELLMPCVQPASLWIESERFEDYGKEMLRFKDRHDNDLLFGPTNEEMITDLCRNNIQSYRDLPKNMYHIQWKFRDEIRPRFGVMRGREFLMKDGYSFDLSYEDALKSYSLMYSTYCRIFADLGVKVIPVIADSGAIGGSLSHEFHIVTNTGESNIYYDKKFDGFSLAELENFHNIQSLYAVADEKHDINNCPVPQENLVSTRGIEVGHIFYFGTKYSDKMNAVVTNATGELKKLEMGSYGIGISRLVAALIEANHDSKGIIWHKKLAPFKISIINLLVGDNTCDHLATLIYNECEENNLDVLYDDTMQRAGSKFATHDLIGVPWQVIVGNKNATKGLVELKERATGNIELLNIDELLNKLINEINV